MFEKTLNHIKSTIINFKLTYGLLALIASIAVPLKMLVFYKFMGVTANFFLVWLITCVFTYLLFASFKNKWIPATIYLLVTILMFADLTYSSFFNRYLSINMLGAAGFIGDIKESIKEVLKPKFFLILIDAILVYAALIVNKIKTKKASGLQPVEEQPDAGQYSAEQASEVQYSTTQPTKLQHAKERLAARRLRKQQRAELPKADGQTGVSLKGIKTILIRIGRWFSVHRRPSIGILILFVLVFNVSGSYMVTSISNQEIFSYHTKDLLSAATGSSSASGSEYMYAITDSYKTEKDGPLFGLAKGKNLIVVQMESLQNFVINAEYNGQEITPNLNNLIKGNTIYFDNYYQQVGSGNTSDAEFATNNSIYGSLSSYTYKLFQDNYFRGLPVLLKEQGYNTAVYHAHEDRSFWNRENAYKSIGFDTYVGGIEGTDKGQYTMTEWMGWGLTDTEFFKQTMDYLKKMPEPFYSFIITLSNHHPYIMLDHYNFLKMKPKDKGTTFGNYLNSAAYTDYAIGQLIQQLKDEGLYENSIIAFYGDHMGLTKTDEEIFESASRFLGKDYDFDTMMNVPLIITVPGAEQDINQTVSISGGQMDFLPTIAYLMGFETLDTTYLGHNLLTIDSGFVAEQTYMTKGSFFQDDIVYEMSRDGVFQNGRAWNKKTGKRVPLEDCYEGYTRSMGIINTSEYILKKDVLRKVYLNGEDVVTAFSESAAVEYPDEIVLAGAPDASLMGTNSLEALNASYDAGYRNIKVDVCWTEDKEAVLLKSWSELNQYFDTDKQSEISLEAFGKLNMKNGLTAMDYLDLIAWIKEHPDVKIIARPERSADFFMKSMESYAGSIMDQLMIEVSGPVEYSGLYNSILDVDSCQSSVDQILDYIEKNHVEAVSLSKESAEGEYKKVLGTGSTCYIEDSQTGIMKRK